MVRTGRLMLASLLAVVLACTWAAPAGARTVERRLYFVRGETIAVVHRSMPVTRTPLRATLDALFAGPSARDRRYGVTTAVPSGVRVRGIALQPDGTARIDLTGRFDDGGGSLSMRLRLAQLVFTATQFPNVDAVRLMLDGRIVNALGGEGLVIDRAQTRWDVFDTAGQVLIESPGVGETVRSPVVVQGESWTWEALFGLRVLGPSGRVLADKGGLMPNGFERQFRFTVRYPTTRGTLAIQGYGFSGKDDQPIFGPTTPVVGR